MSFKLDGAATNPGLGAFTLYPDGDYAFEVAKQTADFSKAETEGTARISFKLTIIDGPDQADGEPTIGETYTHSIFLKTTAHPDYTKKNWDMSVGNVVQVVKACGLEVGADNTIPDCEGKAFRATMATREYTDKKTGQPKQTNQLSYLVPFDGAVA